MAEDNKNPGDSAADEARRLDAQHADELARQAEEDKKAGSDDHNLGAAPKSSEEDRKAAEDDAAEDERRRQYDAQRALRRAGMGLDVIAARAADSGAMDMDTADDHIDRAVASRSPASVFADTQEPQRSVGPNALAPTGPQNSVNAPSARASSMLPSGNGQVVTSQDPRFRGEKLVDMTFKQAVTLTLDDHSVIKFRPGTQGVPESLKDHWYIRAAGGELY